MRRQKLVIAVLSATLTCAAVVAFTGADPVVPAAGTGAHTLRWSVGAKKRYALDVRSDIEVRGADATRYSHRLSADLDIQVFAVDGDLVRLGAQLANITQSIDGEARDEPLLASFFSVTASRDGRFDSFRFPRALPGETGDRLRELLRVLQVIVPDSAAESWKTEETDANGEFTAVYRHGRPGEIRKARIRYATEQARIERSRTTARLADDAWLDSLESEQCQSVDTPTGGVVSAAIRVELKSSATPPAWSGALAARLGSSNEAVAEVQQAIDAARRRPATAADLRRFRDLVTRLDAAGRLGNGLLDALRDAMLDCPELAGLVPDMIARGDLGDFAASALIHALGLTGHREAQSALAALAQDPRHSEQNRVRAIIDLGGVARPAEASCERLWELSLDRGNAAALADTALLALGRAGRTLRGTDEVRYQAMRQRLTQTLQTAVDAEERATVLTAIGNTGDSGLGADVAPHLDAPDTQVRAAAAKALGRLRAVPDQLLDHLGAERTPTVRRQLVASLHAQRDSRQPTLERIDAMIVHESDPMTRLQMARYLGANLQSFPRGRTTLRGLLEGESSNRIRKYIAGVVYAR